MEVDAAPGEDAVAPSQGIRSRWLIDEEEEEAPQSLPNGKVRSIKLPSADSGCNSIVTGLELCHPHRDHDRAGTCALAQIAEQQLECCCAAGPLGGTGRGRAGGPE